MASCTSLSGDTLAEEVETPQEGSPDKYLSPLLDGQDTAMAWDPWNAKMLVRFITFSFVLSKYKTFHRFKHAVGTRLSPEAAIHAGDEMVHDDVSWTVKRIDEAWLRNHPEQDWVHFIVMGNSIDGSYEDYMNAAPTQQKHIDERCDENESHAARFLAGDLDRLRNDDGILHERTVVSEHMENIFPELADQWRISNEEADEIGVAGTSLYMFAWQHAFVETKGRIAALVSEATHTMPISAPLEKLPGWERRAYI
ncbi:hypothetical protein ATERTT37_000868 [Aspergillus terreus]